MAALLEKYRKVAGTGPGSTINLDDWNGLIDELSTTLAGLVKKGADFDAVATVAIGVLLDRINNVLGPAYDQVAARGAQIEALYAQISGTGISADSVIESATRLFLTDARRAAILNDLRGGVPSDGDTLMELYTALKAIPGDVVRYATAQTLAAAPRIQAKANIGALGTGRAYTNAPFQVTKAHVGKVIYCDSSTTFINFDNSNTFANGDMVMVFNYGADLNVNADPNDTYSFNFGLGGVFPKTFAMKRGDRAILHMGEDHWQVIVYSVARDKALMVDRALTFSDAEKQQLLTNAGLLIPQMQCRLVRTSATQLTLMPEGGNQTWINGAYRTIPSVGVPVSNAAVSANTIYHAYEYWTGSAIAMILNTTGPLVDPLYGHKVFSGAAGTGDARDAANRLYSYVGSLYVDGNYQFQDNPAQRWVVSQYGRQRKEMYGPEVSGSVGTSNVEVNSGGRISWLSLGDQAVDIGVVGEMQPSTFDNCFSNLLLDGAQVGRILKPTLGGSGASANVSQRISRTPAIGLHYASLAARTGGSSATVQYQMEGAIHG